MMRPVMSGIYYECCGHLQAERQAEMLFQSLLAQAFGDV
jgi:hypothetical protein